METRGSTFHLVLGCVFAGVGCSAPSETRAAKQVDAGAEIARVMGPLCEPIAAASETLTVHNERGRLEGTLDVPQRCGPMPVVVILSGSGVTDRDGNVPGDTAKPDIYR